MCPHFEQSTETTPQMPTAGDIVNPPPRYDVHDCCNHPDSPLTPDEVEQRIGRGLGRGGLGRGYQLKCKGSLDRCPIKDTNPEAHALIEDRR